MTENGPKGSPGSGRERLLVRGVNWLGDAVMTTPALQRLRESRPQAHIALLTPAKLADLWLNLPWVDKIIAFTPAETLWQVATRLRQARFDTALVLPNSVRSALECWLAGISNRVGYAASWRRWLLTQSLPPRSGIQIMRKKTPAEVRHLIAAAGCTAHPGYSAESHHLFNYLHLVKALGAQSEIVAPRLFVGQEEVLAVAQKFGIDLQTQNLLGINPGAEYGPAKRWPMSHFEAAVREIRRQTHCQCLLLGGPADRDLTAHLENSLQQSSPRQESAVKSLSIINAAGKTSLRELCVLLKACHVLLTNDTGPMHVAAALGTAVVAPFGSTSPELTGPGTPDDARHRLLRPNAACAPCFLRQCPIDFRCMLSIEPRQVIDAVMQLWSEKPE